MSFVGGVLLGIWEKEDLEADDQLEARRIEGGYVV
jgi:hypothetical protein